MQHWTELRTAMVLARLGTVSAAADALFVHRATVSRHVDTLEAAFQTKLFQRHARGYTLTESGQTMLDVAARADEMFTDLQGRSRSYSGQLSGKLIVTALPGLAPLILPTLRRFHRANPEIQLQLAASTSLARLEYGEAHIAFRAGAKPDTPDYVVRQFKLIRFGLYASKAYIEERGRPNPDKLKGHFFVGPASDRSRLPYVQWIKTHLDEADVVLKATDQMVISDAIKAGIGLGFIAEHEAANDPELLEILPATDEQSIPLWLVTHVDLHRTEKVQRFLKSI